MSDDIEPEAPVQLAMIDGRDALLLVLLVKPGSTDGMITVDAHCNGFDKLQAAKVLMHVALQWRAEVDALRMADYDEGQE